MAWSTLIGMETDPGTRRGSPAGGRRPGLAHAANADIGGHGFRAAGCGLEVKLLGPVELTADGRPIKISSRRSRVVLAMLAAEAGRVIPVDRIIDAVWDHDPPNTARDQIQICVSGLRRTLGSAGHGAVIVTRAPGYLIDVPAGSVDLDRFEDLAGQAWQLAEQGDLGAAVERLWQASRIWHGDALSGLGGRLVAGLQARLNERHVAVIEERVRLEMVLGRHASLIHELTDLADRFPLRERMQAQLMLALYRSGRQADALARYRSARAAFGEELGIEPGEELRQLQRAILTQDPSLDTESAVPGWAPRPSVSVASTPRLLPPDIADFTGRAKLIGECVTRLREGHAQCHTAPVLVISGPGGVGKSSAALHLAHRVVADYPDGQLYVDLQGCSAEPQKPSFAITRFLHAIGVSEKAMPAGPAEQAELLRSRLADRRVLIMLDDAAMEEQVVPLIPSGRGNAVVITSRARMTALPGAHHVDVPVFDTEEAVDLLTRIVGLARVASEPDIAPALAELCGHLPLALRIAAARLASRPHWRLSDLAGRLRNETQILDELVHGELQVRASIELSFMSLDEEARRLFLRLSLLTGPDFGSWVAAPLLDLPPGQAAEVLSRLVDVRLVEVTTTPPHLVRYRLHDLVRAFARERFVADEPVDRRSTVLRRLLGGWLGLVAEAHRREYGGDYTVLHGAGVCWALPRDFLDRLLARPMAWWEVERSALVAAVRQAADAGLGELCWDLALTSVTLFERCAYFDDWRETSELALKIVLATGNRRGEAATRYSAGSLHLTRQDFGPAEAELEAALRLFEEVGDQHGRALTLRNLAFLRRLDAETDTAIAHYDRALLDFRTVGDHVGLVHVLSNTAQMKLDDSDFEAAWTFLAEAHDLSERLPCSRIQAQVLHRMGEFHLLTGRPEEAGDAFHRTLRITRDTEDRIGEAYALLGLGSARLRLGEPAQAADALEAARRLAVDVGERLVEGRADLALGELAYARGDLAESAVRYEAAQEIFAVIEARTWLTRAVSALTGVRLEAGAGAAASPTAERPHDHLSTMGSPAPRRQPGETTQRSRLRPSA